MKRKVETIPDIWICGFLAGHKGATVKDAVACWLEQSRLLELSLLQRQAQG
jgi:hypothetical protein